MQLSPSAHVDTFCRDNLPPDGLWPELRFTLPALRYPDRLNAAAELLDAAAAARGSAGRPCLMSPDVTWSYAEVQRISDQVARVLAEDLGMVPGNRVLLRGPNNPWLAACWLGVLKAGGVAVATMSLLRASELSPSSRAPGPGLRPATTGSPMSSPPRAWLAWTLSPSAAPGPRILPSAPPASPATSRPWPPPLTTWP